jgi:hypothetical protein
MRKTLKNNTKRTKSKEPKYCALLDKPCMGEKCALHYDMFGKCSFELIPYNMYPLTVAIQELVEINHDLLERINALLIAIKELDGQKKLFT